MSKPDTRPSSAEVRALRSELKRCRKELERRRAVGQMLVNLCFNLALSADMSWGWKRTINMWLKRWAAIRKEG